MVYVCRVSKGYFDDINMKLNGKIIDLSNRDEEFNDRIKILERELKGFLKNQASKLAPAEPTKKPRTSILIPQTPNLDAFYKKISEIEATVKSCSTSIYSLDQKFKKEIMTLTDYKADKELVAGLQINLKDMNEKLEDLEEKVHSNNDSLESRIIKIEEDSIPKLQDRLKFQDDLIKVNTRRIEKLEANVVEAPQKVKLPEPKK